MCAAETFNKRAYGEKYTIYFEPINPSRQPEITSSGVSSILSKTYTAPFKNLHLHNVFNPASP